MKLVPVVTGQINQGFGWQDWGQIFVLKREGKHYFGCWATGTGGYNTRWYVASGSQEYDSRSRIAPDDLAALHTHFAEAEPTAAELLALPAGTHINRRGIGWIRSHGDCGSKHFYRGGPDPDDYEFASADELGAPPLQPAPTERTP